MNISNRTINSQDVVALNGRIVMANADVVRQRLHSIVERGSGEIVINLSDVEFMDSTGLSVLISTYERAQAKGGNVKLSALTREVRALIELTRLHEIFEIFEDDLAAASTALRAG